MRIANINEGQTEIVEILNNVIDKGDTENWIFEKVNKNFNTIHTRKNFQRCRHHGETPWTYNISKCN